MGLRLCVSAVIKNENGAVLLIKRRTPRRWELPGGFMESGEDLFTTGAREVVEEVGCNVKNWQIEGLSLDATNGLLCFTCSGLFDGWVRPFVPNNEVVSLDWVPLDEAGRRANPIYSSRILMSTRSTFVFEEHAGRSSTLEGERSLRFGK